MILAELVILHLQAAIATSDNNKYVRTTAISQGTTLTQAREQW